MTALAPTTLTTDHGRYTVTVIRLDARLWYAAILTADRRFVPGIDRLRCYGMTAKSARFGAWQEITRREAALGGRWEI